MLRLSFMSLFSNDTRPEAVRILLEGYRRMTPAEKSARVCDLSLASRQMAEARIRSRYPNAGEHEVRLRVAALTLGRDTMMRVFAWDPDREGW
jgi:hypothetical protein